MRKRTTVTRGLVLGVALTGLFASSVSAVTTEVQALDVRRFDPANVTAAVGGNIHWVGQADAHSATQNAGIFDSGAARSNLNFTRTFSAGTFAYHCREHGDRGMTGTVRVAPQVLTAPRGLPFTVRWATSRSNTGNRFDVQYRVGSGRWRTWANNTSARSRVFGARNAPVRVRRGTTYSFKVRSGQGAANSGFSPVRSFRAR